MTLVGIWPRVGRLPELRPYRCEHCSNVRTVENIEHMKGKMIGLRTNKQCSLAKVPATSGQGETVAFLAGPPFSDYRELHRLVGD